MNKKIINKTIVFAFATAFMLSSFFLSDNNKAFAFLGFSLFGPGEEDKSSSTASQRLHLFTKCKMLHTHG